MEKFFDLALGFGYLHIGLVGTVVGLIACLVSLIVWISRGAFLNAIPSAFVVLAMPPMMIGIIPGAESVAVPLALAAAFIALYLHLRRVGDGEGVLMDKILTVALAVSLAAIVVAYTLGSLTSV